MKCTVLKSFKYSLNGTLTHQAARGSEIELPDDMVPALVNEGYVSVAGPEAKAVSAPENKAVESAPEDKKSATGSRRFGTDDKRA